MPPADYPRLRTSVRRLLAGLFLLLGAFEVYGQTLTQIRNTGPRDRRVNVVFVGEAFTAAQEAEFNRQVDALTTVILGNEGYAPFASHINVFRLFVASNQAGPDEHDRGIVRDTYFDSYLSSGRMFVDDLSGYQQLLAERIPDFDLAIMLVNLENAFADLGGYAYIGGGLAFVTTRPAQLAAAGPIVLHETGHAFAGLFDEYVSSPMGGPTPVINAPNVSHESARDRVAWSRFILDSTPTPTLDGWFGVVGANAVGTFPGAWNRLDLFRAASQSIMNSLVMGVPEPPPWGPVNLRAIATGIHRLNLERASAAPSIVRQPVGAEIVLGQSLILSVEAAGTGPITYQWMRGGKYLPNGHRATLTIPIVSKDDAGAYAVEVTNSAGSTVSATVNVTTADGPSGHWDAQDIGAVGIGGRTIDAGTRKTLRGSGANIGGTADAFHFTHQTLSGNGSITARLTRIWFDHASNIAKAGLMLRETLQPNARQASLLYVLGGGHEFQYRSGAGAASTVGAFNGGSNWGWLRLTRLGDTFTSHVAPDGVNWQEIGSATIPGLPATLFVGLASTSRDNSQLLTAEFINIAVTAGTAGTPATPTGLSATAVSSSRINLAWTDASNNETGFEIERSAGAAAFSRIATLGANVTSYADTGVAGAASYTYRVRALGTAGPSAFSSPATATTPAAPPTGGWNSSDVGAVGAAGGSFEDSTGTIVRGSGADIWDRADEFHYRYQGWSGDGEFIARVSGVTNTNGWAKAGIMIRETITATSRHAFMCVSAAQSTAFQYRTAGGLDTSSSPVSGGGAIQWVRLVRSGNTISGYASSNGTTWTLAGSVTLALPTDVFIGLAVTSHNDGVLCEARFDNVVFRSPTAPPPPSTPAAPNNLSATAASGSQINLAWNDASSNETGFEIERSMDDVAFTLRATATAGATTFNDAGLSAATTYYYRVRAVNAAGNSGYSNTANATTPSLPPPPPPLPTPDSLSATALSANRIDLAWSDRGGAEDGFEIERSSDGTTFVGIGTVAADVTSFSNLGLSPSTTYTYRVRGTRGTERSPYSSPASATTFAGTALPPPNLDALTVSSTRIDLHWGDNTLDEDGFEVERSTDGTTFIPIGTAPPNTTRFESTGLTPGTTYVYRVRATRGPERSAYSNPASATTMPSPGLAAPSNLAAVAFSGTRIDLTWSDNSGDETGFEVERSTDGATFAAIGTFGPDTFSIANNGLSPGTTYTYRVRAMRGTERSGYTNLASATTPAATLQPPTNLTAIALSSGRIDLSWTDAGPAEDGYQIERATGGSGFTALASVFTATTISDTAVAPATGYAYRIRAIYGSATSAYSNEASATTPAAPPTSGWQRADIGAVGAAGSDDMAANPIVVRGSGSDIWDNADSFHFAYRTLSGDGSIQVRITGIANTHAWAKAGVMIREALAPGARNTFVFLTPSNGLVTQNRAAAGGATTSMSNGQWGQTAPQWLRVSRVGNAVTAAWSTNGTTWSTITTYTVSYGADALIGLAVTSHANGSLCEATFTNLAVTGPTPPPPAPPAAPTGLTATATSDSAITLSWTDNAANETGFDIERSTDNATFIRFSTVAAGTTSINNTSLAAATTYYYRVRAVNEAGPSPYSNTASARTSDAPPPPVTPPVAPTNLAAAAQSASQIRLDWTDASANETGFELERSGDNMTFTLHRTFAAGTTTATDIGLAAGTTYYYRVRAVNSAGVSGYSNTANARTNDAPPPPTPPAAPTGLSATAISASQINLSWTDASADETGFQVERSTDNVSFSLRTTTAAGVASFNDTGLAAATTYYYRVRAGNAAGNSAYTATASARTADAPPPPPATWQSRDIGAVGRTGSVTAIDGGISLAGSGEDIWNATDEFRYYYQPLTGDGELIARVTSLTNTHGWAKAGVMFRESLDAGSAHALMCVSAEHGTAFQYRATTAGPTASSTPSEVAGALRWVRLVRTGNTINGYESENGASWTLVMSRTFAFPGTIFVGLAVTSHNDATTTTASFTNVTLIAGTAPPPPPLTVNAPSGLSATATSSTQINLAWSDQSTNETGFEIERAAGGGTFTALASVGADRTGYSDTAVTAGTTYSYRVRAVAGTATSAYSNTASATPAAEPPPPPPTSWSFGDIGAVGVSGSNASSGNTITVRGSGSDIWERADSFRFVYRAITGDGVVEARVTSMENTNGWAKAGVMIRESLAPGSPNAFVFVTPASHGVAAQAREAANGETRSVAGPLRNAPYWVRLTRSGTTITAAASPDGVTWTTVTTFTIPMNATAFFGFAVTSHNNGVLNTAVFADPFAQ